MRISILNDKALYISDEITGSTVQCYNLAKVLSDNDQLVNYHYCLNSNEKQPNEKYDNISLHTVIKRKGPLSQIRLIKPFLTSVQLAQPDIVYARGRTVLLFVAARYALKHNIKFVWATNGEDSCEFWKRLKRLWTSDRNTIRKLILTPFAWLEDMVIHYGMKNAGVVINQTEFQKQRLQDNFRKEGILLKSVVSPTIKTSVSKKKQVLWLANINMGKQPELFIQLAKACRQIEPSWQFVLAGATSNSNYWNRLKQMAEEAGVKITGAIPYAETQEIFAQSSIFINTSKPESEGLPNTFIQSWMHGTPVLSLHHNPNGWLNDMNIGYYANGNLEELIVTCKSWMQNESMLIKSSQKAIEFAKTQFMSAQITESYLNVFTQ